jgi:hypothetical protein
VVRSGGIGKVLESRHPDYGEGDLEMDFVVQTAIKSDHVKPWIGSEYITRYYAYPSNLKFCEPQV